MEWNLEYLECFEKTVLGKQSIYTSTIDCLSKQSYKIFVNRFTHSVTTEKNILLITILENTLFHHSKLKIVLLNGKNDGVLTSKILVPNNYVQKSTKKEDNKKV